MRISHDKVSGALYVKLREGKYDHTEDFSEGADVYLDVDAEGTVLGLEALSFEDLAQAIDERGGQLELPIRLPPASTPSHDDEDTRPLREAIASLPQRHRDVLHLFYFEALSSSEVADRLGVPVATALRLRSAALEEVRVALDKQESGTVDDAELEAFLSTL